MIRNRGRDGAGEEGGYSSGGGEVSLGGWEIARRTTDRIKTSRGVAGRQERG